MKQFEYKTVVFDAKGFFGGRVDHEKMENDLNALGSQGWELVNMTNSNESYGSTRYVITVFKREKQL